MRTECVERIRDLGRIIYEIYRLTYQYAFYPYVITAHRKTTILQLKADSSKRCRTDLNQRLTHTKFINDMKLSLLSSSHSLKAQSLSTFINLLQSSSSQSSLLLKRQMTKISLYSQQLFDSDWGSEDQERFLRSPSTYFSLENYQSYWSLHESLISPLVYVSSLFSIWLIIYLYGHHHHQVHKQ